MRVKFSDVSHFLVGLFTVYAQQCMSPHSVYVLFCC